MTRIRKRGCALFVGASMIVAFAALPSAASAAAWGVSDTTDTPAGQACPGFTNCSLREAVTSTEANPGPDAILVGGGTYPLTNGQLSVTQDLTVARVGAFAATISGSDASRIFDVSGSGTDFVVRSLTLTHGSVSGANTTHGGAINGGSGTTIGVQSSTISSSSVSANNDAQGGAIYSDGDVTIGTASGSTTGSSITGNSAEADPPPAIAHGGGVAVSSGTLTVGARTSITGNSVLDAAGFSPALGGGVYADGGATFNGATVSGNTATGYYADGGGVEIDGGVGSFVRSTVSGNTASGSGPSVGGGVSASGPGSVDLQSSTVEGNLVETTSGSGVFAFGGGVAAMNSNTSFDATNSTVASNTVSAPAGSSASGAGVYSQSSSPVTLGAVILAENTGSGGSQCDGAALTSDGYNVLGPLGCSYSAGTGDVTGVSDAGLKALGDYGGLTQTMMLENGSPALDIIPAANTLCTDQATDQRGISRPQNGTCDAGAVEARPATLTITPDPRDFGQAPLSTPNATNVALSNNGDLDTLPPSVNVAAPFSTTGGCGTAIAAGSNCILGLQFAPTAGGRFGEDLNVRAGPAPARDTAKLKGVGWAPTTAPQIAGSPSVGYQTSVSTGRWPGVVASFAIQWERCDADGTGCSDIGGATHAGYRPVAADEGHTLRVRLTATSTQAVTSDPVETAASDVVTRTVPTLVEAPTIKRSSSPVVGTTLYAYRGQWTGAPDSYAFQWIRCDADGTSNCADISGRTANRYTPGASDEGHTLRVRVVATNPAGDSAPATSPPSGVVQP